MTEVSNALGVVEELVDAVGGHVGVAVEHDGDDGHVVGDHLVDGAVGILALVLVGDGAGGVDGGVNLGVGVANRSWGR